MKWFWRQNKSVEVPPELQPYYEQPGGSSSVWRRVLLVLAAVVVLAGIGVAVYFLGPWGSSTSQKPSGQQTATNHSKTTVPKPPSNGGSSSPSENSNGLSKPTPPSTLPSDQNTPHAQSQGKNGQKIVNTGPGDTIAVFVGTALVSTLGYHLLQRRRAHHA